MNKNETETAVNNAEGGAAKADESGNEQQTEQQTAAEEETKELTLDEWKAQQGQRIKPTFNIRKAGEGMCSYCTDTGILIFIHKIIIICPQVKTRPSGRKWWS